MEDKLQLPKKYESLEKTLKEDELDKIRKLYKKMKYDIGDIIGVIAAQSISEPATQTTLRAYHRVWGGKILTTQGLPRLLELFDARKVPTTPTMEIYLDADHNTKEKAREIAFKIKESKLSHITVEESIDLTNLRVEILLDSEQIKNLNIEKKELDKLIKKSMKNVNIKVDKNKLIIEPKKTEYFIKDLQSIRIKTRNIHIKGIKSIEQVIVEKEEEGYIIKTLGSNLKRVLKIKGIDKTKTYTNNIYEIAGVLGIEAARNAIIKEALTTMKEQGVDTDIRHLLLVSDAMTSSGGIQAIGRYGLAGSKSSVLSRANFEETIKHLTTAAARGEIDPLDSVIESIIVGNLAPVGTGMVKLKMKKVKKAKIKEKKKVKKGKK